MNMLGSFLDKVFKPRYEENVVDRMHFRYTGYLLLGSAILLSASNYVGEPLKCWTPAEFTKSWIDYTHDYCFVENTYWLPFEKQIPVDHEARDREMLSYYQWVPFILALQALMFNIPHFFWRLLNFLSGIHVRAVIGMASQIRSGTVSLADEKKDKVNKITLIAAHLSEGLKMRKAISHNSNPFAWIFRSMLVTKSLYVSMLYMLMKLLNLVNIILQFAILRAFLGPSDNFWGASALWDMNANRDWFQTGHFPRVTMCDFEIRTLGNIHRYSVQCVLMINMFNEKVFIFLWWWLVVLFCITLIDFVQWASWLLISPMRVGQIGQLLKAAIGTLEKEDKHRILEQPLDVERFVHNYLHVDGALMCKLIDANAGDLIASFVVLHLYVKYWNEHIVTKVQTNNTDEVDTMAPLKHVKSLA